MKGPSTVATIDGGKVIGVCAGGAVPAVGISLANGGGYRSVENRFDGQVKGSGTVTSIGGGIYIHISAAAGMSCIIVALSYACGDRC